MAIGIYKITSPIGKVYIGQSKDIRTRFRFYYRCKDVKSQRLVYDSIIEYGVSNHTFETIEETSIELLNERERFWQDEYNVLEDGLNCALQGTKDKKGVIRRESVDRMAKTKKGTPSWNKGIKGSIPWNKGLTTGQDVANKKILLDLLSGVFYMSIKEAAEFNGLKRTTLNEMLIGRNRNNTNLIYV